MDTKLQNLISDSLSEIGAKLVKITKSKADGDTRSFCWIYDSSGRGKVLSLESIKYSQWTKEGLDLLRQEIKILGQ